MMRKKTHLDTEAMTILPFEVEELSKQFPVAWYKSWWQGEEPPKMSRNAIGMVVIGPMSSQSIATCKVPTAWIAVTSMDPFEYDEDDTVL
ncbi:unnamed protein product [Caretta caretta]